MRHIILWGDGGQLSSMHVTAVLRVTALRATYCMARVTALRATYCMARVTALSVWLESQHREQHSYSRVSTEW